MPKFQSIQRLTDNLNRVTRENLTGLRVVRAYNSERYQEGKFEKANDDLTEHESFCQSIISHFQSRDDFYYVGFKCSHLLDWCLLN